MGMPSMKKDQLAYSERPTQLMINARVSKSSGFMQLICLAKDSEQIRPALAHENTHQIGNKTIWEREKRHSKRHFTEISSLA